MRVVAEPAVGAVEHQAGQFDMLGLLGQEQMAVAAIDDARGAGHAGKPHAARQGEVGDDIGAGRQWTCCSPCSPRRSDGAEHLRALAAVSRALRSPEMREQLRQARTADAIRALFVRDRRRLRRPEAPRYQWR